MTRPAQKRPVKEEEKKEGNSSSDTGTNIDAFLHKRCKAETAGSIKEETASTPASRGARRSAAASFAEREGRAPMPIPRPEVPLPPPDRPRPKKRGRPKLPEPAWEEFFFELVLFRSRNGSCDVPGKTSVKTMGGAGRRIKLGEWVGRMRRYRMLLEYAAAEAEVVAAEGEESSSEGAEAEGPPEAKTAGGTEGGESSDAKPPEEVEEAEVPPEAKMNADKEHIATAAGTATEEESARAERLATLANATRVLTPDRIEALDSLEFRWKKTKSRDSSGTGRGRYRHTEWEEKYEELRRFREEHGHCDPEEKGPLKSWVGLQRQNNSAASGTMVCLGRSARRCAGLADEAPEERRRRIAAKSSGEFSKIWAERKAKLDELGFVWSKRDRATWEERFEQLKAYKAEHGDCHVPQHYKLNRPLGKWVNRNRTEYTSFLKGRKCVITQERIELLESIGFGWTIPNKGRPRTCDGTGKEIRAKAEKVVEPVNTAMEDPYTMLTTEDERFTSM